MHDSRDVGRDTRRELVLRTVAPRRGGETAAVLSERVIGCASDDAASLILDISVLAAEQARLLGLLTGLVELDPDLREIAPVLSQEHEGRCSTCGKDGGGVE